MYKYGNGGDTKLDKKIKGIYNDFYWNYFGK